MFSLGSSNCLLTIVLLLCGTVLAKKESSNGQLQSAENCPTWTYFSNATQSCQCGGSIRQMISCFKDGNSSKVGVFFRFCMTQNNEKTKVVVGTCPYNSGGGRYNSYESIKAYRSLPSSVIELDRAMCGLTGRTGQLCGQCMEGHSPPVYSYYPQCVNCTADTNNWAKYLAVSLLPTIAFFTGALVFRFRATSPFLNGYILFCQIVTSPPVLRLVAFREFIRPVHNTLSYLHETRFMSIYSSCFTIWNLDFFRLVYTPFCLHPNTSTLKMLSLDYIIAAYPLALIILTYTLVRLHYHNCTLVVWLWRPFIGCFARCRRQWDIQNSLVDAFATFLLLSYVKFLSASFDILMPTFSWDVESTVQPLVVYYDGTIAYFGKEHLPYALLALAVLLVFTFCPVLLLCLYPCRCFQRFLNRYHLSSQTLHTFMDTFQGSFKDGTNGTRDCRYFAAVYLIVRVALYISLGVTIVTFNISMINGVLLLFALLLVMFQPYKKSLYNKIDIFLIFIMIAFFSSVWYFEIVDIWLERDVGTFLLIPMLPIPLLYPLCLLSHHVWKNSERLRAAITRIRVAFFQRVTAHQQTEASLPQQVLNEATALLEND